MFYSFPLGGWLKSIFFRVFEECFGRLTRKKEVKIPFDLVVQILARVPVDDLLRFRSVCKRWESLIRDPKFVQKHTLLHSSRKHLSFLDASDMMGPSQYLPFGFVYERDLRGKPKRMLLRKLDNGSLFSVRPIVGHCRGLFCLELRNNTLAFWNPALRESVMIPTRPLGAFRIIGFGYGHEFKMVSLDFNSKLRVQLLGLESGDSRTIDFPKSLSHIVGSVKRRGHSLGHMIFWQTLSMGSFRGASLVSILCFDLVADRFWAIPGPPREGQLQAIEVIRGRLCTVDYGFDTGKVVVWGADERVESWSKLFNMTLPMDSFTSYPRVTSTDKDAEVLVKMVHEDRGWSGRRGMEVFVYNVEKEMLSKMELDKKPFDPYEYEETLVSPCSFKPQLCLR